MSVPLQRKVKANLYHATSTACLSLLPNAGALSHADTAMQQYQQFVCGITQPFAHLQQQPLFFQQLCRNADVQPQVVHVLVVLTSLVESAANERLAVKQVLYDAIKETLPVVLELFKAYRADSEMQRTIMDFFNVLFGSLRKQLGVDGARHVISAFVELFDARQIELWVAQDNVKSVEVLCR